MTNFMTMTVHLSVDRLSIQLYISMFEKWLSVTAMADGGEQMEVRMHVSQLGGKNMTLQWE